MKNFKFTLIVIIMLAAIPALFYAQIKHESPKSQEQKGEAFEGRNQESNNGRNYITVLTVSIAQ
jgi:hypothetical protein